MPPVLTCFECGRPLPEGSSEALCPVCALRSVANGAGEPVPDAALADLAGASTNANSPPLTFSLLIGLAGVSWQARRAQAEALLARRHAYAADMNLAQQALEDHDLARARELLARHRPQGSDDWRVKRDEQQTRGARSAHAATGMSFLSTVECYDPQTDQWAFKKSLPRTAAAPAAEVVNGIIYVFIENETYAYDPNTDEWTRKANIPSTGGFEAWTTRSGTVDGIVYLFGAQGRSQQNCALDLAFAYDPVQDQFAPIRNLPVPCVGHACATIDGRIYLAGGGSGYPPDCPGTVHYDPLWVFDPYGAPGSWTERADMPEAVFAAAGAEVEGILYVVGGSATFYATTQLQTLYAYDPKIDTWTRKQDMPTARELPVANAVDGILYVIGGGSVLKEKCTGAVESYDPKTDTWTPRSSMSPPRMDHASCVLNGLIYVIGGLGNEMARLATVQCYDPKTDQWTEKTSLPQAEWASVAQAVGGKIYLFSFNNTYAYDPNTDGWTRMAPVPSPGGYECPNGAGGTAEGVVYLFGGVSTSSAHCAFDLTFAYDPAQDLFSGRRMMPEPRCGAAFATINGKIYVVGGASGATPSCAGAVISKNLWVFDPQGGVMPRILSVAREPNDTVRLVWRGEKGRLYGVKSRAHVAKGAWVNFRLSDGSMTIRATSDTVEATGTVPAADTARFLRVYEAD